MLTHERCRVCGRWIEVNRASRHHLCRQCKHVQQYGPQSTSLPTPVRSPSPVHTLFGHDSSSHSHLTDVERAAIVTLSQLHITRPEIAEKIPCDVKAVSRWSQRWEKEHSVEERVGRGRKRKVDDMTPAIVRYAHDHPHQSTSKQIKRELQLPVCARTVRNRLNEAGLFGRVTRHEFPFTPENLRKRLSFAQGYGNWNEGEWGTVLWSDECHIYLGPHGQQWVQRPVGAAYEQQYMTRTTMNPPSLSFWGCMSGRGIGALQLYMGDFDAQHYTAILGTHLLPSARRLFPTGQWWFQQDNPTIHTGRVASRWFATHGIDLLDFPPYSPDLSPIENLWANLKRRVEKHNARDTIELSRHLKLEWTATDASFLSTVVHSMPRRCKSVVQNQGHKIHY